MVFGQNNPKTIGADSLKSLFKAGIGPHPHYLQKIAGDDIMQARN
jgi:hypothetical protein